MELALQRIEECKNTKDSFLNLSNCGLTSLPNEVIQLTWLQLIFCDSYQSTDDMIPNNFSSIESISNLTQILNELPKLILLSLNGCNINNINFLANLINLKTLNLSNNFISNIDSLSKLVNLKNIDLSHNKIYDFTPLSKLVQLSGLELQANNISDIDFLTPLINLEELDLGGNQISEIKPLAHLEKLNTLFLLKNEIRNIKPLSRLVNLETISISFNKITDISPLLSLKNLKSLYLNDNQITDIQPLIHFKNIEEIFLRNNPINTIPSELIDFEALENYKYKPDGTKELTAIEDFKNLITTYYNSIERNDKELQTGTKLILVGNSTAGKTSLSRILRGQSFEDDEPTTHGIKVKQWMLNGKNLPFLKTQYKKYKADIRIWDFGGQEYYHGTHRLFLDTNAIYILLWEKATNGNLRKETKLYNPTEDKKSLEHFHYHYWLDNIRYYAPAKTEIVKSPVLMVQNKVEDDKAMMIDTSLCADYKVQNTFPLSTKWAKTNKERDKKYRFWFELFREELLQTIFEKVHQKAGFIPKTWDQISQWLSSLAFDENPIVDNPFTPYIKPNTSFILLDDFRIVCKTLDKGITDFEINLLKDYFHNKGLLFHRPGMTKIFIKSTWVTEGIYKILNEEVLNKQGKFTFADVLNIFPDIDEARLLRDLMEENDIIYTLWEDNNVDVSKRDETKEVFVAPQYLSIEHPMQDIFRIATIGLKAVSYTVKLPMFFYKKILDKLIFDYGSSPSVSAKEFWKYGILFIDYKEETRIMIQGSRLIEEPHSGRITISIEPKGDFRLQQKNILKKIREGYANPLLSFDGKNFVTFEDIQTSANNQSFKILSDTGEWLRLKDFDVFLEVEIQKPLSVFISYAHKDTDMMNNLLAHLSPLKRLERIEPWSDQQLRAGDEWNENVLNRLREADIILLLLSADFLASKYIWEKELKVAIEKHQQKEALLIPILLRDCQWKIPPFDILQTIPHDSGKSTSIRSWQNQNFDEAWTNVVKEIQKSIDVWQPKKV